MMTNRYFKFMALLCSFFLSSCKNASFLDARPDRALIVPETLEQLQQLLDNDRMMNGARADEGIVPSFGEIAGTDYYYDMDPELFTLFLQPMYQRLYTWQKDPYPGENILDWNFPYRGIFYANVVLDQLDKIKASPSTQLVWNNIRGSALFYRAHLFYWLLQTFAPSFDPATASSSPGIYLRLHADANEALNRASVEECYALIVRDLIEAGILLPATPLYKTRPSSMAAHTLLSRTYLTMQQYPDALRFADSCLKTAPELLNFGTLDPMQENPFPRFNDEVIFHAMMYAGTGILPISPYISAIDSGLYTSYDPNDLRKSLFYKDAAAFGGKGFYFRGSYDGTPSYFAGISVNELYLIRAECLARLGEANLAMQDINTLLKNRWAAGSFAPLQADSPQDALAIVLLEKRKELPMRGLHWTDLRRLNQDPATAIPLVRVFNGHTYILPVNDPRYVFPLPSNITNY